MTAKKEPGLLEAIQASDEIIAIDREIQNKLNSTPNPTELLIHQAEAMSECFSDVRSHVRSALPHHHEYLRNRSPVDLSYERKYARAALFLLGEARDMLKRVKGA